MPWNGYIYTGKTGLAWTVEPVPEPVPNPTLLNCVVDAPWAHPVWHQYALAVVHLRDEDGLQPAIRRRPDVTHEVLVFALAPDRRVAVLPSLALGRAGPLPVLQPANHGYQFSADDDGQAVARIRQLVEAIADGELNPDTDARATWNGLFDDGVPLVKNIFQGN